MREIRVGISLKTGVRLDEYILSVFPALPKNALYKAFRKKDVRVGGKWARADIVLKPNDILNIYLSDDVLFGRQLGEAGGFLVVYEDMRVLIANKSQGLPVLPDRGGGGITLIELVREYIKKNGDPSLKPESNMQFEPAMCHRIDRNTGGLVVIAKDRGAQDILMEQFNNGGIKKEYRCIVYGKPEPPAATLRAYIKKDSARSIVKVIPPQITALSYAQEIVTRYKTMNYDSRSNTSKLEVSLLTGRTHQIRAHLASIGHPIIGDGKYCPGNINRMYYAPYQMLVAFRLKFPILSGLSISGKVVEIPDELSHPEKR